MRARRTKICAVLSLCLLMTACSNGDDDAGKAGNPDAGSTPDPDPCGLHSGWDGDEYCILPPPEDKGFQVHYGPKNYDDDAEVAQYLIGPGADTVIYPEFTAGNKTDAFFYKRQYRMRRGSHHLIVYGGGAGSILGTGRRLGGSQNVIKDNPAAEIAPENVGIGMPLAPSAALTLNLHHFNGTKDKQLLREAWVNFWYVDPKTVTQQANEIFIWAFGDKVAAGGKSTVKGKKTITVPGRILTLYGHRHSNNVRFAAWWTHEGKRELVLDDYDWLEPAVFEFNSVTTNPGPNPDAKSAGGHSGKLELSVGDTLEWECDVENKHDFEISFGENEGASSEMCILVGDALGPALVGVSD